MVAAECVRWQAPVQQQQADGYRHECERDAEERQTPRAGIGCNAADQDAGRQAENLPDQEARQHRLPLIVRHHVADPCHRQRNDRGGSGAGQQPREQQQRKCRRQSAERGGQRAGGGRAGHHQVFAVAIAERAEEQLRHAVRDREHHHHARCGAQCHAELMRQQRQQRIGHAQRNAAGERGQRQQRHGEKRNWKRGTGCCVIGRHPGISGKDSCC